MVLQAVRLTISIFVDSLDWTKFEIKKKGNFLISLCTRALLDLNVWINFILYELKWLRSLHMVSMERHESL